MSVTDVQGFIARYLRDPGYRAGMQVGMAELPFDDRAAALVRQIDLDALGRAAAHLEQERIAKRQNEFGPFLAQLGRFTDLEAFYGAYVAEFVDGDLSRRTELVRFYHFASGYVLLHDLPAYLIDLLKRQYHGIRLAEEPAEQPPGTLHWGPVDLYHRVALPKPWMRLSFGFDVVAHHFPAVTSAAIQALIVRNLGRHKLTNIVAVRERGPLDVLSSSSGGGRTVLELIEAMGAYGDVSAVLRELAELRASGVLLVMESEGYLARREG